MATPTIVGSELCVEYDADAVPAGTDEVCLVICDQTDQCDTITIPVTIVPPLEPVDTMQPPVVVVPPIVVPIDSTIDVCLPIIDPNTQDTFNIAICDAPDMGTLNSTSVDDATDQACLNYSAGNMTGTDSICVVVCDDTGLCDTVTVPIIIVNPEPQDPPVILPNPIVVLEDSTTTVCMSCLLYTSPSPRDATLSRMPSSA